MPKSSARLPDPARPVRDSAAREFDPTIVVRDFGELSFFVVRDFGELSRSASRPRLLLRLRV
jgi:hypothetical protein